MCIGRLSGDTKSECDPLPLLNPFLVFHLRWQKREVSDAQFSMMAMLKMITSQQVRVLVVIFIFSKFSIFVCITIILFLILVYKKSNFIDCSHNSRIVSNLEPEV